MRRFATSWTDVLGKLGFRGKRQRRVRTHTARHRRSLMEALEPRHLLAITVNTLVDENDGVGVGAGTSLREAIAAAPSDDGIVEFDPSLFANGTATIT